MTLSSALNEPITNSPGWDVPLNNNFTIIDGMLTAVYTVSITSATTNLGLPSSTPNTSPALGPTQSTIILLTGNLTTVGSNAIVNFPATVSGKWTVRNATTGSYTVTLAVSGSSGATVVIPQGYSVTVYSDLTNIYLDNDGLSQGGGNANFGAVTATSVTATTVTATNLTSSTLNGLIVPRIQTITSASTITPTSATADIYEVSALATNTTIAAPSGTPVDGQKLILRITSNATGGWTFTWTTTSGGYRIIGTAFPTSIVASKTIYVGCIYNSAAGYWDVLAVGTQS